MILFGMLLGAAAAEGRIVDKMRNVRRGMIDEQLKKVGDIVKANSKKPQT